jgi:2-phosphoglycerate kinase
MARTIGLAETTARTLAARAPRLLIISGATGTGKSTAALKIASKSNFSRILSTDAIREIMRSCDQGNMQEALHRSSFSIGSANDPIIDWLDTCQSVETGIEATINRALREGIDLLLEGVHIVPSEKLLSSWREAGGIALGIIMAVSDENKHKEMLRSRDAYSFRRADRYLANFGRIRSIQEGLMERSKISNWPIVDISRVKNDTERIQHLLDLAWNENRTKQK